MRVRVKICGITRQQDALAAVACGVDAIGLNFHPKSSRYVTVAQAISIVERLPAFVSVVGLFVDALAPDVQRIVGQVPLSLLQFHGNEPATVCESFGRPYIKAFNVAGPVDVDQLSCDYPRATALLLDAKAQGVAGGSGRTFDWAHWPPHSAVPLILAGGLSPANVAAAIRTTRPFAVDVCTGVESAPGLKDASLIQRFVDEVARADSRQ